MDSLLIPVLLANIQMSLRKQVDT